MTSLVRAGLRRATHGLPPDVFRLGWISFLTDISTELLYPVLPIFLTTVIGAPVSAVGLIEGAAEGVASLLKGWMGRLSDRMGRRRPFVFWGYVLSAAAKPLLALASGWGFVLVARCLDRVGKSARAAPRDALLAASVPKARRGQAFGLHRAMDTAGAVLGPLLSLGLLACMAGKGMERLRWIFLLAFVPGILGSLLVLRVTERAPAASAGAVAAPRAAGAWRSLPVGFRRYAGAWALFSLTNSSDMFLILRAKECGMGLYPVVGAYAFYNLVYAFGSAYLGELSDRIGRRRILIGGLVLFAVVYMGFAAARSPVWIVGLFAVYGIYIAASEAVGTALAVDLLPDDAGRASGLGALAAVQGLGAVVASVMAGWIWTRFGSSWAFVYGAAGALLSAVCMSLFCGPENTAPAPESFRAGAV